MQRRTLLAAAALALLGPPARAQNAPVPRTLKVLFIGNSYTYFNDLPQTLAKLAASATPPLTIETGRFLIGGATLQRHWREGKALELVRQGEWDYVVLQDQSMLGGVDNEEPHVASPAALLEFARLFNAEIRKSRARTVFYLTWAREGHPELQARLTDAYRTAAREMSALLAPVGLAVMSARILNPAMPFYRADHSHPSPAGTYLAACVFYAVLTGRNPVGLPSAEVGDGIRNETPLPSVLLSAEDAAFLQKVAWRTVQEEPATPSN